MTSNVGSTAIAKGGRTSIGFLIADDESTSYAGIKALVMEELKTYFRPELLNRIDEVVVFHPLEKAQVCQFSLFFNSIDICGQSLQYLSATPKATVVNDPNHVKVLLFTILNTKNCVFA